jgi:hypothetical protein
MWFRAVFVGLTLLATCASAQEFTPTEMEEMIKSMNLGCVHEQLQRPENQDLGVGLIANYCRCFSELFVYRATRTEMGEIQKFGMRAKNFEKINKIYAECKARVLQR